MHRNSLLCLLALLVRPALPAVLHAGAMTPLRDGWRLQSACKLQTGGEAIALVGFPAEGWLKTSVPSTVLAAQVSAGAVPDPYLGDNIRKLPGASQAARGGGNAAMPAGSPYLCGWWYRDQFTAPAAAQSGARYWLHFGGINYRADIWLNGHKIADKSTAAGAYRIFDIDVTGVLEPGKANVLAAETFAPTATDLGVAWVDWNPTPPDRDMGLWGAVDLETTGPVALSSPTAVTHFEDETLRAADLTIYGELRNGSDQAVKGVLSGTAAGVSFEQPVVLAAHENRSVAFTPRQFPQLRIHNPQIWWPWQMGRPHLEQLKMSFSVQGRTSDEKSAQFGIREITSELTAENGSRLFRVNGKPILIRGGGWAPDMMLRNDESRMRTQIRMILDLHLNTIRLEGKLETDDFFRLADEDGLLVMPGWCCCSMWERWPSWTADDLNIATSSLREQLLRLRSHPSILVFLNGSDHAPTENVEKAYESVEAEVHWPNPVLNSASVLHSPENEPTGVKMSGPYDYVPPSYWYIDHANGGGFGFNTETGPGTDIPPLASRKKFLPDADTWPIPADWILHAATGSFASLRGPDLTMEAMQATYAKPGSAADYERMADTMAYDSERAMFEAYSRNKYTSTGVIQWMLNDAWPGLVWNLWDYYLNADAGYFAVKKACEPLHIQYSYDDRSVEVVNSLYKDAVGLHASVSVHGLAWNELYSATAALDSSADSARRVFTLPGTLFTGADKIFFIDLKLSDAAGRVVSHNFYWVPATLTTYDWTKTRNTKTPVVSYEDLTALSHLPAATVGTQAQIAKTPQGQELRLHLDNRSSVLAFQLRAAVRTAASDLIAPVYWSDNWIELAPGESATLTALLPEDAPGAPVVQLEGWNVPSVTITPQAAAAAK